MDKEIIEMVEKLIKLCEIKKVEIILEKTKKERRLILKNE